MQKRDYGQFDKYVTRLTQDVYAQPPDPGTLDIGLQAINTLGRIPQGLTKVLDVGCGQGIFKQALEELGMAWIGITLGEDFQACKQMGLNVMEVDMTFTPFKDKEFDFIFARHVVEHSPFPLITLMEFRRICSGYLLLIVPSDDFFQIRGRNHYSILHKKLWEWLLKRSGWYIIHEADFDTHDPIWLKHLEPYQEVVRGQGKSGPGGASVQDVLKQYPKKIFEHRFLCEQIEPRVE